jgi:hypothetical protein
MECAAFVIFVAIIFVATFCKTLARAVCTSPDFCTKRRRASEYAEKQQQEQGQYNRDKDRAKTSQAIGKE